MVIQCSEAETKRYASEWKRLRWGAQNVVNYDVEAQFGTSAQMLNVWRYDPKQWNQMLNVQL